MFFDDFDVLLKRFWRSLTNITLLLSISHVARTTFIVFSCDENRQKCLQNQVNHLKISPSIRFKNILFIPWVQAR